MPKMCKGSLVIVRPEEPNVENKNKSVSEGRVGEVLNCDEPVDLQKLLIPVRIEPFGGTTRDHPGIDEAMEMVCQGLCWWKIQCSTSRHWERQDVGKTQWRCRGLGIAADSGCGVCEPCLGNVRIGKELSLGI